MSRRNLWAGGKIQVGTQTEKNMMNSISSKVLQLTIIVCAVRVAHVGWK